jgi:transposase-like protein
LTPNCEDFDSCWKDVPIPKPYPVEFRRDVVAVARKSEAPLVQIAKDFGISDACLHNWLKRADLEDGLAPGVAQKDTLELREAKKRIRLLEQEAEVMRRAVAYLSRDVNPK